VQGLSADRVRFTTIPVTGTPTMTDDAGNRISVVAVDPAAVQAFAEQVVAPPSATPPASTAAPTTAAPAPAAVVPGDVTVQVVNGTGRGGLAASGTAALRAAGFRTEVPVNGPASPVTVVRYPAGLEAQATAVAAHLPGAVLRIGSGAPVVTVVLGSDGVRVAATAPAAAPTASAAPSSPRQFTTSSCID
jgi:hypothetical protein